MAKRKAVENDSDIDNMTDDEVSEHLRQQIEGGDEPDPEPEPAEVQEEQSESKPAEPAPTETPDPGKAEDEEVDPKSATVPHGKFHQERERRKQAEVKAQEAEQRANKAFERLTMLLQASDQKPAPEPEKPADDTPPSGDPLAMLDWLVKEVRAGRMEREEAGRMAQEEGSRRQLLANLAALEDTYRKTRPDYDAALAFASQSRDEELQLMYPWLREDQRRGYIMQEWISIADSAMQMGLNPAEQAYRFAEKRGYRQAEPQPQPQTKQQTPETVASSIAAREETRRAAMSLGSTGGGVANTAALSPEQVLELSDADFDAFKKKFGSVKQAFAA